MWTLETSGSYVYIKNRSTGLYIDGRGNSTNGSYAGQWTSSTSNNLQWQQETVGSYVKFKNRATGLYLDGLSNTTNGADLGQWASSTGDAQQWTVTTTTGRMATHSETAEVDANDFHAFPNPFSSSITVIIQEPLTVKSLELYDLAGRQVEIIEGSRVATKQTMGSLAGPGIYILKVNRINKTQSKKIIKN